MRLLSLVVIRLVERLKPFEPGVLNEACAKRPKPPRITVFGPSL